MSRLRGVLLAMACATVASFLGDPAMADPGGSTITVTSGEAGIDLVVPGRPGTSGSEARPWQPMTPDDIATFQAFVQYCRLFRHDFPGGEEACAWLPESLPATADPAADLALRLRAELTITMAGIRTAPPVGRASIVGVATWLWVEPVGGQVLSVTATEGPLSVTVTARPGGVDWDTGDGGRLHCGGSGSPFVPGRSDPGQRPACSHTYAYRSTRSDPAGTYVLRASMTYQVGWSANTGQGGALAPATVTAAVPITVHELQAVLD